MLLREHGEALEADFQRFYGLDLYQEVYGPHPISARRFVALTRWLPEEAAVWRSTKTAWSTETELQAVLIEVLDSFRRLYLQAHSKKGAKLPDPISIPRPYKTKTESRKSGTTLGEMLAMTKLPVRRRQAGGDQ